MILIITLKVKIRKTSPLPERRFNSYSETGN